MIKKIDRYIFWRLTTITLFVLGVLIFIFIVIDFSEHSEDFTDKGATMNEIFGIYYFNYIPEIIRLVIPVAVFVACLYLTGQMADRFEIIALKAAGISLYRLLAPYLAFAFIATITISALDGFIIPDANSERIAFESKYLKDKSEKVDNNRLFRQESPHTIFKIGYFNVKEKTGYRIDVVHFEDDSIARSMSVQRMKWQEDKKRWRLEDVQKRFYTSDGYITQHDTAIDTTLNMLPRDLARTTSDIYQLTYPEAEDYIQSIERSGAGNIALPKVQLYGRYAYPFSIVVVILVGFALASERRKGGKGFHIAAGLIVSFLYLVLLKVIEPFGGKGEIEPFIAALLPHLFFLIVGTGMLLVARK